MYFIENNATMLTLFSFSRGYPRPFNNTWYENDKLISSDVLRIPLHVGELKVPKKYINKICNRNGCIHERYTVKFSTGNGKIELEEDQGKFIDLRCEFLSKSPWISEWVFNNSIQLGKVDNAPTTKYTFFPISKIVNHYEGEFECKANDVNFKWEKKRIFYLKVVKRTISPYLNISSIGRSSMSQVSANCTKKVVFYCHTGEEENEGRWYRFSSNNSRDMDSDRRDKFIVQSLYNKKGYFPEFIFGSISIYDVGLYTCLDQNNNIVNTTWLDVTCSGSTDTDTNQHTQNQIEKIQNGKAAPYIIRKILSVTSDGTSLRFWCPSRGYPTPTINWIKNTHENIQNETVTLLLPGSVNRAQKNLEKYTCSVCNENGCINETYLVEIKENAIISLNVTVNQRIEIGCEFDFTSPFTLEWYFYNESENKTLGTFYFTPEEVFHYYSIDVAMHSDEGTYECKANNSEKKIQRRFYLHITNKTNPSTNNSSAILETANGVFTGTYGFIFVASFSLILLLIGIVFYTIIAYRKLNQKRKLEKTEMQQFVKKIIVEKHININSDMPDCLNMPTVSIQRIQTDIVTGGMVSNDEYEISIDQRWEFPRNNLRLGNTLGKGEFGKVVRGEVLSIPGQENVTTTVAVKMLKDDHTDNDVIDFVSEMELMKLIDHHPNILQLIGCCTQKTPLLILTEYAAKGNLKNYLQKLHIQHENVPENTLMKYALQIAQGMEYLASIKCIHRDLAARNVLVMVDLTMKIADFGLARNIRNKDYYKKTSAGRLPIKWMAPEAILHHHYTTKSDVWSFGILFWEIVTLGSEPYPAMKNMAELLQALSKNYRMEKPPNTSSKVYNFIWDCWKYEPEHRPDFSTVVEILEALLTNTESKLNDQSEDTKNTYPSESDEIISTSESSENTNDAEQHHLIP
ncbi:fibroblast growth factor receptor 2-like [Planococcus citri]|uniref:fibroblast growth factor receptor 2-like n=1 Tax=Planococcus citri TaxID=170843 RepID=UPI0031F7C0DB